MFGGDLPRMREKLSVSGLSLAEVSRRVSRCLVWCVVEPFLVSSRVACSQTSVCKCTVGSAEVEDGLDHSAMAAANGMMCCKLILSQRTFVACAFVLGLRVCRAERRWVNAECCAC